MPTLNKRTKELVLDSLALKLKALEKCVSACLKEKQTDAAEIVNNDIKALLSLQESIKETKV